MRTVFALLIIAVLAVCASHSDLRKREPIVPFQDCRSTIVAPDGGYTNQIIVSVCPSSAPSRHLLSREIPRPAKRGEGGPKGRVRGVKKGLLIALRGRP
jgi:hypothetical protein